MVISSTVRRGAYFSLLETSCDYKHFEAHSEAVLCSVTSRLGFESLAHLCQCYATQLGVSSVITRTTFFSRISPALLGYSTQREVAEQNFDKICPIALESSDIMGAGLFAWFASLCSKNEQQILRVCFSRPSSLQDPRDLRIPQL